MKFSANFLVAAVALMAVSAPATASSVFSDNFDSEPGSNSTLNYAGFANFDVTGQVDLVKTPEFGISCAGGAGKCVDLDGTSGPGQLTSKNAFAFNAGDLVKLVFDYSGSQRNTTEDFYFGFQSTGGAIQFNNLVFSDSFFGTNNFGNFNQTSLTDNGLGVPSGNPFTTASFSFTAGNSGALKFFFGTNSSDNIGILVDNIGLDISAVPEPATWMTMILGFGLVGSALRRRQSSTAIRSFA